MAKAETTTTKVTARTLKLAREISAKTGEKLYAVFERLVEREKRELFSRGQKGSQ